MHEFFEMTIFRAVPHSHKFSHPCQAKGCFKFASRSVTRDRLPLFCSKHAPPEFVSVFNYRPRQSNPPSPQKNTPFSRSNICKPKPVPSKSRRRHVDDYNVLLDAVKQDRLPVDSQATAPESDNLSRLMEIIDLDKSLDDEAYFNETLPPCPFSFKKHN